VETFLRRHGVRIAYEITGVGEPTLAFLPAWAITTRRAWSAQVAALAPDHRVIAYDGRGSGGSDRPTDPSAYEMTELVADAVAVLEAAAGRPAVLVGNSLGGLVGYLLAAQRPDLVAGLVLVGGSVDLDSDVISPMQRAAAGFDRPPASGPEQDGWWRFNRQVWATDYKGFVGWFVGTALGPEATDGDRADGVADGLDVGPEVLTATVGPRYRRPPAEQASLLRGLAERIACPVLVVNGDRDEIVPPAWGTSVARRLVARHAVLPGAGHCPHVTRPAETAALIRGFLAEVRS
jgi:pimeloyl-ACP methyl ester carboxylesterase